MTSHVLSEVSLCWEGLPNPKQTHIYFKDEVNPYILKFKKTKFSHF